MTPKRKPLSALARLTASHMRLLKVQRGLIEEIGHLRKLILAMQPQPDSPELRAQKQQFYADMFRMPPNDWPRL